MPEPTIEPLQSARIPEATAVLARAFDDSPITRYLLPGERSRHLGMRTFFRAAVVDAHRHGEAWIATLGGAVAGVALWQPPGSYPPDTSRQLRQLAPLLGIAPIAPGGLVRALRYLRGVEAVHPHAPHWYLATLGVDPPHQGHGLGTLLLDAVLPRVDAIGLPTYLETDKDRNLAYYRRFRFEQVETLHPTAAGPPTWTMWRDPAEG